MSNDIIHSDSIGYFKNNINYGTVEEILPNNVLKVRITGTDKDDSNEKLIPCVPFLPLFFNITPEVGQGVLVIQGDNNTKGVRYWIGPLHSGEEKLDGEKAESAKSILPGGPTNVGENVKNKKKSKGLFSTEKEIAIQGRGDGDLIFKKNETVLRINKFMGDDRTTFNNLNVGYLQLKSPVDIIKESIEEEIIGYESVPPEFRINAIIRPLTYNGEETEEDDEFAEEFQVFVQKIDKDNSIIFRQSSSEKTLVDAKNFATDNIRIAAGDTIKWLLETTSPTLQNLYPSNYNYEDIIEVKRTVTKEVNKAIKKSNDSIINVVADRINLISYDGDHNYNLTNGGDLINNKTQKQIQQRAQSIVYGEKLVEFLGLVKDYVINHVHAYHGVPSDPEQSKKNLLEFDLESILNKNIKTN